MAQGLSNEKWTLAQVMVSAAMQQAFIWANADSRVGVA